MLILRGICKRISVWQSYFPSRNIFQFGKYQSKTTNFARTHLGINGSLIMQVKKRPFQHRQNQRFNNNSHWRISPSIILCKLAEYYLRSVYSKCCPRFKRCFLQQTNQCSCWVSLFPKTFMKKIKLNINFDNLPKLSMFCATYERVGNTICTTGAPCQCRSS